MTNDLGWKRESGNNAANSEIMITFMQPCGKAKTTVSEGGYMCFGPSIDWVRHPRPSIHSMLAMHGSVISLHLVPA